MTARSKTAGPARAGLLVAGLGTAVLMAGCGGGGGGGGGSSVTPPPPAQTLAGPLFVSPATNNLNATVPVGSAQPGAGQTPEVDVLPNAAPAGGVTVSISTDPSAPSIPGSFIQDSPVYDIEPAGAQFVNPGITIRIPYTNPAGGSGVTLIYYYDAGTQQWLPVPNSQNDVSNSGNTIISITTNQIQLGRNNGGAPTDYAVLTQVVVAPPPPVGGPLVR